MKIVQKGDGNTMPDRENKTSKPLTIGDIADALGVSKTTVSRAISGKGRVSIKIV